MRKLLKKLFPTREKVLDAVFDVILDVALILFDVLTAPIVLPARLAMRGLRMLSKSFVLREARGAIKKSTFNLGEKNNLLSDEYLSRHKLFDLGLSEAAVENLSRLQKEFGGDGVQILSTILENMDRIVETKTLGSLLLKANNKKGLVQ